MVECPVCGKQVNERDINAHLDSACQQHVEEGNDSQEVKSTQTVASIFGTPGKRVVSGTLTKHEGLREPSKNTGRSSERIEVADSQSIHGSKRTVDEARGPSEGDSPPTKRHKVSSRLHDVAPLADRMRPQTLDDVYGQELVGPDGVIRGLVENDRVPSMVLWGGPGTGKTTIARLIAHSSNARFVEINSTSTGVGECKKLFSQAMTDLQLTGRKTIIFCDEIHRFSKSQQDVFLGPVEAGLVTLIGATTENPSFKVISALLSRCRVFTLASLAEKDIVEILRRALRSELEADGASSELPPLLNGADGEEMLSYLATAASGDARTALNLLELAISLSSKSDMTLEKMKHSLTHTLIYDRQGDAHYDTISALHKSVRGSDADAALYYLARMLSSGEDPLYVARRLIVIASEDVGLADSSMLSLAIATHDAVQKIGLPEARINLAHCVTALALSPKSTRAYRALSAAMKVVADPKTGGLPIPLHLRNAPTRLMTEIGYGKDYKYNPDYVDGRVKQEYLPKQLVGWTCLEDNDLGGKVDPDVEEEDEEMAKEEPAETDNIIGREESTAEPEDVKIEQLDEAGDGSMVVSTRTSPTRSDSEAGSTQGVTKVEEDELWEQDGSGHWSVRTSSQAQAPAD